MKANSQCLGETVLRLIWAELGRWVLVQVGLGRVGWRWMCRAGWSVGLDGGGCVGLDGGG